MNVDQFCGIEIEEFPAQIARVALWLVDHQMNLRVGEEFGQYFARIPLVTSPRVVHGNALTLDWQDVLPAARCSYVLGNPPFVGKKEQNAEQKAVFAPVMADLKDYGVLDFVAAWYVKAARYIRDTALVPVVPGAPAIAESDTGGALAFGARPTPVRCAFVSTNSITQGEQVGVLWGWMLAQGVHIHFAHRTFAWSNEARRKAAVHCVIVGFGLEDRPGKVIYEYADIKGKAHAVPAANINPYLVDAPDVVLARCSRPVCDVPVIGIGNKSIDGGNYLFTTEERDAFIAKEPASAKWFRRWLGADEFLNGYDRWCLWLADTPPAELRAMPEALKRVQTVKVLCEASKSAPTRALAATPTRFHVENMPRTPCSTPARSSPAAAWRTCTTRSPCRPRS